MKSAWYLPLCLRTTPLKPNSLLDDGTSASPSAAAATLASSAVGRENWLRWGGALPPVGLQFLNNRQQARIRRGVATVAAVVRNQRGLVPWRGGELKRRLQLAEWPVGDEPPLPLPDLEWALDQYERQEGACYYTGVTLILSGPIYTTPFVLSFERLDESLEYTRTNTVFIGIAAEFNSGYGVQMSTDLADLFYGPKRFS